MSCASGLWAMRSAATNAGSDHPPDEVATPALAEAALRLEAGPRADRAAQGPGLDTLRAIGARAGRALGMARSGGRGRSGGMRSAGLAVVRPRLVGAEHL